MTALGLSCAADGLTVLNRRDSGRDFYLVLGLELGQNQIDVLITQTIENLFMGFGILFQTDGLVFIAHVADADAHLVFIVLGLRPDCHAEVRLRIFNRCVVDNLVGRAQGIVGFGILQLDNGTDITGEQLADTNLILAVDDIDLADLFVGILDGIDNLGIGVQNTAQDLQVGDPADERVDCCLEDERGERFVFIGFHVNRVALGIQCLDMALLGITREVFGNQVHQALDTDLVNGGAAVYRTDIAAADTDPQALGDLMNIEFLFHEELFHQFFVSHGNRFGDFHVVFFDLVSQIRRDFLRFIAVVKVPCLLPQDIDGTDCLTVLDNRHFERDNALAELAADIFQDIIKVGIRIVHLVDEEDGRQLALAYGFLPGSFRACFDTFLGINNNQGIVTNTEAGDFFAFIVHVAGGVDEVDLLAFPFDRGQMAVAGQAALAFFRVKVQGGCAVGVCAESFNCLGEIQAGFDHRALAGPGVSQDNNVSYFICQIVFHFAVLPYARISFRSAKHSLRT